MYHDQTSNILENGLWLLHFAQDHTKPILDEIMHLDHLVANVTIAFKCKSFNSPTPNKTEYLRGMFNDKVILLRFNQKMHQLSPGIHTIWRHIQYCTQIVFCLLKVLRLKSIPSISKSNFSSFQSRNLCHQQNQLTFKVL